MGKAERMSQAAISGLPNDTVVNATALVTPSGGRQRPPATPWRAVASGRALIELMDVDLDLGDDLRLRTLAAADAAVLAEATSGEPGASLWGPHPVGRYTLRDAHAALAAWDPAAGGQFCLGIMAGPRLLGAVGLMPDRPGSIELAYWVRPEERGNGLGSRAVRAATRWAHQGLAAPRIWLEIEPGNQPSLRLARRAGYRFEQRIPRHCRDWASDDAERDTWHDCLIWVHTTDSPPGG